MRRRVALAAFLVMCSTASNAQSYRYQGWSGQEDWDNEVCVVSIYVDDGLHFIAQEDWQGRFWIGVKHGDWDFRDKDRIHGAVSFDNDPPILLDGVADGDSVLFLQRSGSPVRQHFSRKRVLRLSFGDAWVIVNLRGSSRAADFLGECAKRVWPGAGDDADNNAASPDGPDKLIAEWLDLNSKCRGGRGDDPLTEKYCEARELLSPRIEAHGYTYGCDGDFGYQLHWRKDCPP